MQEYRCPEGHQLVRWVRGPRNGGLVFLGQRSPSPHSDKLVTWRRALHGMRLLRRRITTQKEIMEPRTCSKPRSAGKSVNACLQKLRDRVQDWDHVKRLGSTTSFCPSRWRIVILAPAQIGSLLKVGSIAWNNMSASGP